MDEGGHNIILPERGAVQMFFFSILGGEICIQETEDLREGHEICCLIHGGTQNCRIKI